MSTIKRITVFIFAALILAANLPLCASAVDPVSAATMANALAQAITAYGASQGVSMTFDVTNTDGIGEGVHDLWDQFVDDVNDPNTPDYDSLAITMWSNLYSKIGNNLGINISDTELPFIDSFWNWLLTGPAEMTKVDNQYYEWNVDQSTGEVNPINVFSHGEMTINGYPVAIVPLVVYNRNNVSITRTITSNDKVYGYIGYSGDLAYATTHFVLITGNNLNTYVSTTSAASTQGNFQSASTYGNLYYQDIGSNYLSDTVPIYSTGYNPVNVFGSIGSDSVQETESNIDVIPYIGDATPQNVYIPDNNDVNYNPTDVAIPLDIPWDNTLFGNGDGVLTDVQSEAAAAAADDAITDSLEKTLTIAETDNPDVPAPGEVYVPFLPVELPSFNFNLSGIWHYVREWITSLGAWFATVMTVWASLPYAMVVPVYATLVIVIVLGVYKRFFM